MGDRQGSHFIRSPGRRITVSGDHIHPAGGRGKEERKMADTKKKLFEKFGEFGSAEELNRTAEGLKEEGDTQGLRLLAEENGIDLEDAADFMAGDLEQLASEYTAAEGRLKVEEEHSRIPRPAALIIYGFAKTMLDDPEFCIALMKKGARVDKVWDEIKRRAMEHREGNAGVACGTDRDLKAAIMEAVTG